MNELAVIPECYVDTCLIETVTSFSRVNHQKGCNNVVKVMQTKFYDRFALGIIDQDKRRISYLEEFDLIGSKQSLLLYKHTARPHYIIQLSPAVEGFILSAADKENISLSMYGLPEEINSFTKITKQLTSKENPIFRKLFRDLIPAEQITLLAELVNYLVEHPYSCDMDLLKSKF